MAKLLLALLLVPSVQGIDTSMLEDKEKALAYAKELALKSTEGEQEILKTMLKQRGNWHPDASSLLEEIDQRDGEKWRRLNVGQERRLTTPRILDASQSKTSMDCDGATEAECNLLVDEQCSPCLWQYSGCRTRKCSDYSNQTTCCANPHKIEAGCRWQKGSSSNSAMTCVSNICENIIKPHGMTQAERSTACNAAPNCFSACASGNLECLPGRALDHTCTCWQPSPCPIAGMPDCRMNITDCKKKGDPHGMQALSMAPGNCNMLDCAKCLKDKTCTKKKELAIKDPSGGGGMSSDGCKDKCATLTQCDSETECMFCGKKAAGCTPAGGTIISTCTDPPLPKADATCGELCKGASDKNCAACATGDAPFQCGGANAGGAQQGAIITTGAAAVAIIASMLF